jgi:hypothetical protein
MGVSEQRLQTIMRRNLLLSSVLLVTGGWLLSALTGRSLIVLLSRDDTKSEHLDVKPGTVVQPLAHLNFTSGTWAAYVVVSTSDFAQLPPELRKANCFRTTDVRLLQQMQREWQFVSTGGDMATVESTIYFFRDRQLVSQSGLVLDPKSVGLQSSRLGWLKSTNEARVRESISRFTPVLSPVVVL